MKSETRQDCENAVRKFSEIVNTKSGKLLYVGTAGDPVGGEYSPMFHNYKVSTFDIDPKWRPDIVGDITKTEFPDASWDAIVCVQTIEHIPNLWDVSKEMHRILVPGGFAIVDSPFMYPYHAEPPSFGDYWRITKDGMRVLFRKDFEIVEMVDTKNLTSCLVKKL